MLNGKKRKIRPGVFYLSANETISLTNLRALGAAGVLHQRPGSAKADTIYPPPVKSAGSHRVHPVSGCLEAVIYNKYI
jgi:hypothetical protein